MKVEIERVENGYLITFNEDDLVRKEVIEISEKEYTGDDSKANCEAFQTLCWSLSEILGFYNSKHNQYRLNIEVEKQED